MANNGPRRSFLISVVGLSCLTESIQIYVTAETTAKDAIQQIILAAGRKETKVDDCQLSEEAIATTSSMKNVNSSNPVFNGEALRALSSNDRIIINSKFRGSGKFTLQWKKNRTIATDGSSSGTASCNFRVYDIPDSPVNYVTLDTAVATTAKVIVGLALDKARSQAPSKNYRLAYGVVHCSGAGGSLSGGDSIASQDRTLLDDDSPLLETLQRHKRSQTCNFYLIPRADDTGNDVPEVTLVRDHEMMSEKSKKSFFRRKSSDEKCRSLPTHDSSSIKSYFRLGKNSKNSTS